MSKTALLYELRGKRQSLFLNNDTLLSHGKLDNLTFKPEKFHEILDNQELANYKLLMLHKSDIDVSQIEAICKQHNIALVLFSGGITQTIYTDSLGFPYLKINSKDFYNDNLSLFLTDFFTDENNPNLLKLAYGEEWKLATWLKMSQKIKKLKRDKERLGSWDEWEKHSDIYGEIGFNALSKLAFNTLEIFPNENEALGETDIDSLFNRWQNAITKLINQKLN